MTSIRGPVTREKLAAWLEAHRPELALYERDPTTRGFYRRDSTPRADFRNCGSTWRDVAARLGAIEVADTEDSGWGGARPKSRPDDKRGGARKGSGAPKLTDPVAAMERTLKALERRIAALDEHVNYAERQQLFRELDRLHEQIEIKLVEAPDYSDRLDDDE